jgi:hypothetical protein
MHLEEGPGADLDLHGPPRPAEQGSDANRHVQQGSDAPRPPGKEGSGPPRSPARHEDTTTVLEVPAWSPGGGAICGEMLWQLVRKKTRTSTDPSPPSSALARRPRRRR